MCRSLLAKPLAHAIPRKNVSEISSGNQAYVLRLTCFERGIDDCPANPALGGHANFDLTKGKPDLLSGPVTGNITYGSEEGATFQINHSLDGPTLVADFYIMFGRVDVLMKTAPGQGIVSSLVLLSDDLDEVDFEILGATDNQIHTNYFGHRALTDFHNDIPYTVNDVHRDFHLYSFDWTADAITWSVDNKPLRKLKSDTAGKNYPQSPMRLKIGPWPAGDSDAPGTIGMANYSPFSIWKHNLQFLFC